MVDIGNPLKWLGGKIDVKVEVLGDDTTVFEDDFAGTAIDTGKWDTSSGGGHLSQNDKLIFASSWDFPTIKTQDTFLVAGADVVFRILQPVLDPGVGIRAETLVEFGQAQVAVIEWGSTNQPRLQVGSQYFSSSTAGVQWNATTHAYLRIVESGGSFFYYASADGESWNLLLSEAHTHGGSDVSAFHILSGIYNNETGTQDAEVDDVSIVDPGAWHDITDDVMDVTINRGKERWAERFRTSSAVILFDNTSGVYSTGSQILGDFGEWRIGRELQVYTIPDPDNPTETHCLFTGVVEDSDDEYKMAGFDLTCRVLILDALSELHDFNPLALATPTANHLPTDEYVEAALDRMSWPDSRRIIETGLHTMQPSQLAQTALEECQRAADAEGGAFFADCDNNLVFRSRDWLSDPQPSVVESFDAPESLPNGLTWDGTHLWLAEGTLDTIYKLDPSDGSVVSSFASPSTSPADLAWDGTHLWHIDYNTDLIYRLDPSDGSVVSSFATPGLNGRGLTWDGANLWHGDRDTDTIYKLDPSDGSVVSSFASPGAVPMGLAWDGTYLWNADLGTDLIYRLDPSDGSVLDSFASPDGTPTGLTWDGTHLWVADQTPWPSPGPIYRIKVPDNRPVQIQGFIGYDSDDLPAGSVSAQLSDVRTNHERARVRNDIQFARAGGSVLQATDAESIAMYRHRTYRRLDLRNSTNTDVQFLLDRYLEANKDSKIRVTSASIAANDDPDNDDLNRLFWDTQFGDLLQIKIQTAFDWALTRAVHVFGIRDHITPHDWTREFLLDDAQTAAQEQWIVVAWGGTAASIPSGWVRVDDLDGRYPKGGAFGPGIVGGSAEHSHGMSSHQHKTTHSHTLGSTAIGNQSVPDAGGSPITITPDNHTHPISNTTTITIWSSLVNPGLSSASNDVSRKEVIFIRPEAAFGGEFPVGSIAFFDSATPPSGWVDEDTGMIDGDYGYLKGASGDGSTSFVAAAAHDHTLAAHTHSLINHSHSSPSRVGLSSTTSGAQAFGSGGSLDRWTGTRHSHPMTVNSVSTPSLASNSKVSTQATHSHLVSHTLALITKSSGTGLADGLIVIWFGAVVDIPSGWVWCNGENGTPDLRNRYPEFRRASGAWVIGATRDTPDSHSHSDLDHTHTNSTHNHSVTVKKSDYSLSNDDLPLASGDESAVTHLHPGTAGTSSNAPTVTSAGGSASSTTPEPPFYEVVWIMKVTV